jgi:putative addiction module antidote
MHTKLEVIPIGDSLGVILPEEILQRLDLEDRDTLAVTETATGVQLTPTNTVIAAMKRVIEEHKDVLKRLADS